MKISLKTLTLATIGLLGATVSADTSAHAATQRDAVIAREKFRQDHDAIVAMAGTYKVQYDFRETVSFVGDYTLLPAKVVSGHEVVKVIEDTGTRISLQHLLVAEGAEGAPLVVKHWRQTWEYEPGEVLTYNRAGQWVLQPVAANDRAGAWSQTVWQTDDSPRYGGVGRWVFSGGVTQWQSNATLRPLARRDAVRHPVYDHYLGINRQSLTPTGWVHEQDNAKLGSRDGKPLRFAQEVVVNTYTRADDFNAAAAEQYWLKTQAYWAAVRDEWTQLVRTHHGINVPEQAENGSATGPFLMQLAQRIAAGEVETADAIVDAQKKLSSLATRRADITRPATATTLSQVTGVTPPTASSP